MSNIEKLTGELRALSTGVERAQGQAAAAGNQAQEVAARAAGAGFVAVAAGMTRVRDAINAIQGRLGELGELIAEATKRTAAAVSQGATPEETISGLAPVQSALDNTRGVAARTIEQATEAQQLVTAILQGGQPGPMLSALENIKQVLTQVAQRTGTAHQLVNAAIAEARQLGSSGN
ncbi:DUF6244 family protein [Plantactinospora solaniradicis]|uniref:DUF6244 family protein n=1 Tax=Plantactinospora solaniradicis TaxID=1723736 RepID=A0ABW1KCM8_9ACTN